MTTVLPEPINTYLIKYEITYFDSNDLFLILLVRRGARRPREQEEAAIKAPSSPCTAFWRGAGTTTRTTKKRPSQPRVAHEETNNG